MFFDEDFFEKKGDLRFSKMNGIDPKEGAWKSFWMKKSLVVDEWNWKIKKVQKQWKNNENVFFWEIKKIESSKCEI